MTNPEGYTALGFVGFTDKGTYDPTYQYAQNDLAHRAGSIWRCLIDNTQGITPTEGTNWTLFMGEPTNMAEKIIAPLEDSPSESSYSVGQQLIFNDNLYEVIGAIAVGDNLVTYESDPTNANIKLAPKVSSQIQTLTNKDTAIESEISDVVNVLGSKNLLPNNATTQVLNGIIFTVNDDGTVTASGTASGGDAQLTLSTGNTIKKGTYILSGCPSGGKEGDTAKYALYLNNNGTVYNDYGDGTVVTFANDVSNVTFAFGVASGQTVSGTVKPMLRPANIVDGDYAPYAMTNRELTEIIEETGSALSFTTGAVTDLYIKKCGRVVMMTGKFYNSSAVTSGGVIAQGTISSEYKPICYTTSMTKRGTDFGMFNVDADGAFSLVLLSSSSLAANRWLEVGITFLV